MAAAQSPCNPKAFMAAGPPRTTSASSATAQTNADRRLSRLKRSGGTLACAHAAAMAIRRPGAKRIARIIQT